MLRLPTALKSLEYISCLHYADCVADLIHLNQSLRADHDVAGIMLMTGSLSDREGQQLRCLGLGVFSTFQQLFTDISQQDHLSLARIGLAYETPFAWSRARQTHANSLAWNLFELGLDQAGLHSGYSMYTQISETDGRFLCAHIASNTLDLSPEQASLFEYIMPYLTRAAAKHWIFNDDLLTVKQREIIECLRQGLSLGGISKQLRIPVRAVRFHLRRICELTQSESIDDAVRLLSQLSYASAEFPHN